MADIFKSSTEAGQEVRSRGQTGITPNPNSQALENLGSVETKPQRLGIRPGSAAAADPSLIDAVLNSYDNGTLGQQTVVAPEGKPNPVQAVLDAYDAANPAPAPTPPQPKDVGFTDSVKKGYKGLMLTWDYLANKLENAVTGSGADTAPILEKSVNEYKSLSSDPRIQELIQKGNDAPDYYEGAKAMLKYVAQNPGVAVNFLGEQLPAMVASLPVGGAAGSLATNAATRLGVGAATRTAIGASTFGAGTNASAVVLGSLGTNYVEGLDKFKGDTAAASDYAATKTLSEVPANAVAGLFMGVNPLSRVGGKIGAVGNAAFQAGVQGTGGAVGAIQAAESVGEQAGKGEVLAELLGEAAFAPVELATSGGGKRPGAAPNPGVNPSNSGEPVAPTPSPAPTQPSQDVSQFGMTDQEFFGMQKAKDGPAFLASLYAQADPDTQAQLQNYVNKTGMKLDLDNASKNESLVTSGNSLVSSNPTFVGQFQERLGEFYSRTRPMEGVPPVQADVTPTAPVEKIPVRERMRMAQDLANEGQLEAAGALLRTKPLPEDVSQNLQNITQNPEVNTPVPSQPSSLAQLAQAEAQVRNQVFADDGQQILSGKNKNGSFGAKKGNQSLLIDKDGNTFWGERNEAFNPTTGESVIEGADKDATPATFATGKEARAAGEKTKSQGKPVNTNEPLQTTPQTQAAPTVDQGVQESARVETARAQTEQPVQSPVQQENQESNAPAVQTFTSIPKDSAVQYAVDYRYAETPEKKEGILKYVSEVYGKDGLAEFNSVLEEQTKNAPPAQEIVDKRPVDVINSDPNRVISGTYKPPVKPKAPDIIEQERMAKISKENKAARKKEFETASYSDAKARALIEKATDPQSKGFGELGELVAELVNKQGETVGKVFETKRNGYFAFRANKGSIDGAKPGTYAMSKGKTLKGMAGKDLTIKDVRKVTTPTQKDIDFNPEQKAKRNQYEAKVKKIMTQDFTASTMKDTIAELRAKLKDIYNKQKPFFKYNKKQSDVEYIFDQFAQVGAMEAGSKKSNPVQAISQAIERAQKQDVAARAGLALIHADRMNDALEGVKQEMKVDGFSDEEIDRIVGSQQESLNAMTAEEPKAVAEQETVAEEVEQPTLDLDTKRSDRIQAAMNAIAAIEESGGSDMSALWKEMRLPKGDRQFQFSDFRAALAMKGKDVSAIAREVSQFPAATTRLADFVYGNPKGMAGNYSARDAWVRSYNQIKNILSEQPEQFAEYEKSLTEGEKRVIQYIDAKRDALKMRRRQQFDQIQNNINGQRIEYVNALYSDVRDAFPHALFNNYSLKEMADPNKIPEADRSALEGLVYGETKYLHRLWLDDVAYALDARKDLRQQIMDGLTKEEQKAVIDYQNKTSKVILDNARRAELGTYMTMLDNIASLDRNAYNAFRNQIVISDLKQVPQIIQAAERTAELQEMASNKKELNAALDAMLAQIYKNDEMDSVPLDQSVETVQAIDGQELPQVTDAEVDAYLDRLRRVGESEIEREDARAAVLYEKIADAASQIDSEDSTFVTEQAAGEEFQPENNTFLDGDILYKRGTNSHGPAAATVAAHLAELTYDWPVKPNYSVLMNPAQISDPEVRARVLGRFENGAFKGAIDTETGQVFVFSQFLDDVADAEFVLLHELYGHWGMRYFLGDKLNSFLETQYKINQSVKELADAQFEDAKASGQPMSRLESIEEAISDMAARGEPTLFRELVGRLAAWMRQHGMETVANWLDSTGDKELAYVLSQARQAVRTQQGISPLNGAPDGVLYARNKQPVEMFATRDNDTKGYARLNPVTREWTVFTKAEDGSIGAITVEEYDQAYEALKKVGKIVRSTDRSTRQEADPKDVVHIPDSEDLTGLKKFARHMQIQIQNQYLPVFEVAEFLNRNGKENTVIQDLKLYEGRLKYYVDRMRKKYAEPIQQLLKEIGDQGGDVRQVDRFLLAQHAEERNKQINKINPRNTQGSGMSTKDAKELLKNNSDGAWTAYRPQLEKLGKLLDKMSTDHVNYMKQTGLINADTAEALNIYEHYRNLSGNEDLGLDKFDKSQIGPNGFNFKGKEVQTATGRGTEAIDILQNTMNSFLSTLIRGQKAVINRSILQMLEQNPDATYVQINPIKEKKRLNLERLIADKKILKYIGDAPTEGSGRKFLDDLKKRIADGVITPDEGQMELIERIQLAEEQRVVEPAEAMAAIRKVNEQVVISGRISPDGYVSMVEDPNLINQPNVLVARVDGKPILMSFTNRGLEFVQAVSGGNQQSRSDLVNVVGAWNRFFSQLVTSWNPAWILPNGFRDVQTAFANASADPEIGPKLAAEMTKEWTPSLKTAFRYLVADQADTTGGWWGGYLKSRSKAKPIDPAEAAMYQEFRKNGGETFFLDRKNVEETLESLNRHMNGPEGALGWTKDKLESVGKLMELMSMPMEAAPRFAMYKVLRRNGWSPERAATYAKELTVNFNMKGASSNFRSLYVFANPAVQGTYRLFQNYSRGSEGVAKFLPSNQFAATAGVWIVMGLMGNMIARAIGGEDEDKPGVDKLDMIPNYKRATSLILAPDVPGGAIPIAYGWNVFHTLGHYMADVLTGKLKSEEAAGRVLSAAFDSFAPIGSGAESQTVGGAVLKTILPSPLVPVYELGANENRFGAPIYKEQSPFSDVKEANAYMHFDTANPISKSVMQGLNTLTGGNQYKKGLIDVNPGAVDYFIQSYMPGLFTEVYKGAGLAIQAARGEDTKRSAIPVVDRLTARIPEGYDAGAMRRASEVVSTKYAEFMAPGTTREEKQAILKEHPNLGNAQAVLTGADQQIKALRQQLKAVNSNPGLSDDYKVAARNKIKEQEKAIQNRVVNAAIKAGFRDAVIGNGTDGSLLNRAGAMARNPSSAESD